VVGMVGQENDLTRASQDRKVCYPYYEK